MSAKSYLQKIISNHIVNGWRLVNYLGCFTKITKTLYLATRLLRVDKSAKQNRRDLKVTNFAFKIVVTTPLAN